MRNAELLETNTERILNFRRLPEISLYQSSVTPEMVEEAQENAKGGKKKKKYKSQDSFPANYRYYWESFDAPNKIKFDIYTETNKYLPDSDIKKLYSTMAPTNIRVKSFKSYDGVKSSEYSPKQQLINEIWYTDMIMRTNSSTNTNHVYIRHDAREIRTQDNESNFIKYLNKDATFQSKYRSSNYITEVPTSYLAAQYSSVNNNFFINDSLQPNILSEFLTEEKQNLEVIMNELKQVYTRYFNDSAKKSEYEYWYISSWKKFTRGLFASEDEKQKKFNEHAKRLSKVINTYKEFCNNSFEYYNFEVAYNNAGEDIETFLKYVDEKEGNVYISGFANDEPGLYPFVVSTVGNDSKNAEKTGTFTILPPDTIPEETAIPLSNQKPKFSIAPNPSDGVFNVLMNGDFSAIKWSVYSLDGVLLKEGMATPRSDHFTIKLKELKSGAYLWVIDIDGFLTQEILFVQ